MKFTTTLLAAALCLSMSLAGASAAESGYVSPYRVEYSVPAQELYAADQAAPRNNTHEESEVPYDDWYSGKVRKEFGAWGPRARCYPQLPNNDNSSVGWKRQRVLAVACSLIGLPYQHHHIPDWDPPADWPWKEVAYGRNSKGVDCSDFTSWCYNYGLGIKLNTGIGEQAETTDVDGPGGQGTIHIKTIANDGSYDELVKKLRTGDLLYIRNKEGKIGHVIMWVGEHGHSPDGTPLVIDSTGMGHTDSNGNDIPVGVHLRPFTPTSWYYKSLSHAHRILHD